MVTKVRAQTVLGDGGAIARHDVGHQLLQSRDVLSNGARGPEETVGPQQRSLDLAELHAEAPKLDLPVDATAESQVALRVE